MNTNCHRQKRTCTSTLYCKQVVINSVPQMVGTRTGAGSLVGFKLQPVAIASRCYYLLIFNPRKMSRRNSRIKILFTYLVIILFIKALDPWKFMYWNNYDHKYCFWLLSAWIFTIYIRSLIFLKNLIRAILLFYNRQFKVEYEANTLTHCL